LTNLILLAPVAYLAASVNFSILLFKLLGQGDPRERFSGNAGTVNVTRQVGMAWGAVILLLEMARGGAIALAGTLLLPAQLVPVLGFFLVLGSQKPFFHGFRGGKGVAGYLGFSAFISPISAGASCLVWVFVYRLFRQPFIGSFFMIAVLGLGTMIHYSMSWPAIAGTGLTMAAIYLAHKSNIIAYTKEFTNK
jgi:glycerol-3-phosphate acyltransferase PlsY